MDKNVYDIFIVTKKGDKIYECINKVDMSQLDSKYKKIESVKEIVYVYNNLTLTIDLNKNTRKCFINEDISTKIFENKLINNKSIQETNISSFPFIDKYHDIVERTRVVYENGINIITEKSKSSNEYVSFIRVSNKNEVNNILNIT
jgi:hypothetical protein